jgi:hypothetical protein
MQPEQSQTPDLPTLEEVKVLFEEWRRTRQKARERIPDYLWSQVACLLGRYRPGEIQKRLGINGYQLNSGRSKISLTPHPQETSDPFIKVSLPMQSSICEPSLPVTTNLLPTTKKSPEFADIRHGQIELIHPNGVILRIAYLGDHQLSNLLSTFMGGA